MVKMYQEGKNTYEIAPLLGRSPACVIKSIKKSGHTLRDASKCMKRLMVKETYFQYIDTPTKAYLLGMIYADGNVYKNRFYIKLWEKDRAFLEETGKELGFNGTLYLEPKRGPNRQNMLGLTIYGRDFVSHLRDKGIVDNKTNKLVFPTFLAPELIIHFIHGIMDGDGCITFGPIGRRPHETYFTTGFSGCYVVMNGIKDYFANLGIVGCLRHNKNNHLSGVVVYSGTKALQIANLIYCNRQHLFLHRKYQKYKDMVSAFDSRRSHKQHRTQTEIDKALSIIQRLDNAT